MSQLLDRIIDTDSETLVKAYEDRIKDLEAQKTVIAEKVKDCGHPLVSFDESLRTA